MLERLDGCLCKQYFVLRDLKYSDIKTEYYGNTSFDRKTEDAVCPI